MDNITAKVTEHGEYGYGYDDLYRLTSADNPEQADEGFTYDAVGNRLTAEGVADDWNYNDNNELQGYDGVAFQYDANGNTIQKNDNGVITNYIYNVEDRLERVEDGSGSLISSYYYDPSGRRLWKEVGGVKTYFFYADEGLIGEYDQTGAEIKTYGYKPNSTWTTDPLFMKIGAQYYFYQNDHLGTPQKMSAVNGAVVWSAKYSSFDRATVEVNAVENNLRFPGQYFDEETGLHYNRHRYYDAMLGRYLRVDPIRLRGGINLYLYSNANPIKLFDPRGLAIYKGYCRYISGGEIVGVGQIRCRVWTICRRDGTREVGELIAVFGGMTAGLPASVTYFNIEQDNGDFASEPKLSDLEGLSSIYSISAALGIGSSIMVLNLGSTSGEYYADSYQAGIDASVDAFGGYSWLEWSRPEKCCD